jgi:hypothetical protein
MRKRCQTGKVRIGNKCKKQSSFSKTAQKLLNEVDDANSRDRLEEISSYVEDAYYSNKISVGEFDAILMEIKHFEDKY